MEFISGDRSDMGDIEASMAKVYKHDSLDDLWYVIPEEMRIKAEELARKKLNETDGKSADELFAERAHNEFQKDKRNGKKRKSKAPPGST